MIRWLLAKWRDRHDPHAVMQTLPTPISVATSPDHAFELAAKARRKAQQRERAKLRIANSKSSSVSRRAPARLRAVK